MYADDQPGARTFVVLDSHMTIPTGVVTIIPRGGGGCHKNVFKLYKKM